MTGFKDSNYVFTDPVRYFKENDPYYWEVDNIPLKQLQENCLWLKDQIAANPAADGIDRSEINELLPYAEGTSNIVKVKPGRFTARINDAYRKGPLQKLSMLTGQDVAQFESFDNISGLSLASDFVSRLQSSVTASALSLNGLIETVLNWPVVNDNTPYETQTVNGFPALSIGELVSKWPLLSTYDMFPTFIQELGASYDLPRLSAEFIKQFRGVARTAVVDVPEELEIRVPNFDAEDFFVFNPQGAKQLITAATVRIDLLFIYSKPIDTSSATIQKWSGGQPTTITKPILGLVRGAGVGISNTTYKTSPARDLNGNSQILADYKDVNVLTNGFQASGIHGSFPSPDDLMNIAPLISEKLAETDAQLIGQTILPIAYIVVRKNATQNSFGNLVLTNSDIVDIRPFFRTTELTYNERAGLAAAMPAPSLANPVATQYNIDLEANKLKTYVDGLVQVITGNVTDVSDSLNQSVIRARPVAGGTVWGGLNYGIEGAINYSLSSIGIENLFTDAVVPALPDWDLADWWEADPPSDQSNRGDKRGDRINYSYFYPSYANANSNYLNAIRDSNSRLYLFIKKKINIDRSLVPWMADYEVVLSYKNCFPYADTDSFLLEDGVSAKNGTNGLYYEKFDNYFVIYCVATTIATIGTNQRNPRLNRDSNGGLSYVSFSSKIPYPTANNGYDVLNGTITSLQESNHRNKNPRTNTNTYPTVSFEVIGYPSTSYSGRLAQGSTPTIIFR